MFLVHSQSNLQEREKRRREKEGSIERKCE
jgi:hypothetical protein